MARRAALLETLRADRPDAIYVELGGFDRNLNPLRGGRNVATKGAPASAGGQAEPAPPRVDVPAEAGDPRTPSLSTLERLKVETYYRALVLMRCDAFVPSADDLGAGVLADPGLPDDARPAVVLTNATDAVPGARAGLAFRIGDLRALLLGIAPVPGAPPGGEADAVRRALAASEPKPDVVVLASTLTAAATTELLRQVPNIDLALSAEAAPGPRIVHASTPLGKQLGVLRLKFPETGDGAAGPSDSSATFRTLFRDSPEHADLVALLRSFYSEVERDPELHGAPLTAFAAFPEEAALSTSEGASAYAGAAACKRCHAYEHALWETTKHKDAYFPLLQEQKHFVADCVGCHVTGFGVAGGFRVADAHDSPLASVGCESCHGPGRAHAARPLKTNVRRAPPRELCAVCHAPDQTPLFAGHEEEFLARVDHSLTLVRRHFRETADNAEAHDRAGLEYARDRKTLPGARIEFRAAVDLDPENPALRAHLATALHRLGEFEAAASEYRKALDLAPGLREAAAGLALALEKRVPLEAARPVEDEASARCHAGRVYALLGMPADAIRSFEAALAIDPRRVDAHAALAAAYAAVGNSERAAEHARHAAEPGDGR